MIICLSCILSQAHYDGLSRNPYTGTYGLFEYSNQVPYNTYIPSFPEPDLTFYLSQHQPLNLIAETPQVIGSTFSILPMLAIPKDNVNMISGANILGVSQKKPFMTIKTESNSFMQCIPGVRIELEQPMWIYATKKTSIVFPSEVLIYHGGYRIPLRVGAVLAPVSHNSFFYNEIPVEVRVVYAVPVPSRPITIESITQSQEIYNTILEHTVDNQAVVVDSNPYEPPQADVSVIFSPQNVTLVEFPQSIDSPNLQVDEEDELVNRNPPQVLAPAGIVQSTQPEVFVESFHNSKESPVLTALKQEKLKQKLQVRETNQNEQKTITTEIPEEDEQSSNSTTINQENTTTV
ncbi:hypothetical protein HHI36_004514 [Cryptolaemus montrouzieri]|uniref:Uncharacterized protein n=1 Tax=Cryptolaemus montrouzieri TaxID=559131 RepID=A0ABD2NRW4_9CUCU